MKKCTVCRVVKNLPEYNKRSNSKDGFDYICRECQKIAKKQSYSRNKDTILAKNKAYRQDNLSAVNAYQKEYRQENAEITKIYAADYREKNRDKIRQDMRVYVNTRNKTDLNFKLRGTVRARLQTAVRNNQKAGSAIRDLGCTIPEFKLYIESLFQPGMTWDNWGHYGDNIWNLDHKIALSTFDLTDREQFLKACHYTNMQPLWSKDNFLKSDMSMEEFLKLKEEKLYADAA